MATNSAIRRAVREVFEKMFPKAVIVRVRIKERMDEYGESEIDVGLVLRSKGDFDPRKIPAFITAVVAQLDSIDEERFPIISFIETTGRGKRALASVVALYRKRRVRFVRKASSSCH